MDIDLDWDTDIDKAVVDGSQQGVLDKVPDTSDSLVDKEADSEDIQDTRVGMLDAADTIVVVVAVEMEELSALADQLLVAVVVVDLVELKQAELDCYFQLAALRLQLELPVDFVMPIGEN